MCKHAVDNSSDGSEDLLIVINSFLPTINMSRFIIILEETSVHKEPRQIAQLNMGRVVITP
jgi:hypothetical protein